MQELIEQHRKKTLQGRGCSAVILSLCLSDSEADSSEKWPQLLLWSDAFASPALIVAGPQSSVCRLDSVPVSLKSSPCGPAAKCDGQQLHPKVQCVWAENWTGLLLADEWMLLWAATASIYL